jgi:hypothetical protein
MIVVSKLNFCIKCWQTCLFDKSQQNGDISLANLDLLAGEVTIANIYHFLTIRVNAQAKVMLQFIFFHTILLYQQISTADFSLTRRVLEDLKLHVFIF